MPYRVTNVSHGLQSVHGSIRRSSKRRPVAAVHALMEPTRLTVCLTADAGLRRGRSDPAPVPGAVRLFGRDQVSQDAVDDGLVQQRLGRGRPAEGAVGLGSVCRAVGVEAAGQRADLTGQRPDLGPLRLAVQEASVGGGRGLGRERTAVLRKSEHAKVLRMQNAVRRALADVQHGPVDGDQMSVWQRDGRNGAGRVGERPRERLRRAEPIRQLLERAVAVRQEVRGVGGSGAVRRGGEEGRLLYDRERRAPELRVCADGSLDVAGLRASPERLSRCLRRADGTPRLRSAANRL